MARRIPMTIAVTLGLVGSTLVPSMGAMATSALNVQSTVTGSITASMPVVRLHFTAPVVATKLPALRIRPALATKWQQIGPREVQAVVTGFVAPLMHYTIEAPTSLRCAKRCTFAAFHPYAATSVTDIAWEQQLLATLHYLPLNFTPQVVQNDPAEPTPGTYSWSYPNLPAVLSSQWRQGAANVIVTGALKAFQDDHHLASTGVADAPTWNALVAAVRQNQVDGHSYNYVVVSETQPETLTLYVAGVPTFHALVNTGISVAPTALGTYPVYVRYTSTTMSGTNPDGSHYSDPGIPWVSYFNGGDALHGFIRSTYGWPQSLGCVEMPFAVAKTVWPFTPIGTLVTVVS